MAFPHARVDASTQLAADSGWQHGRKMAPARPAANARRWAAVAALVVCGAVASPRLWADGIPLGGAAGYAVLYEGVGGHNLSITNVTINGSVGVGGTGVVQYSGPGTIGGALDFAAANTGQFHNTNGSNVGPSSVNYGVSGVTSALNTVNALSLNLAGLGAGLTINGTQTINESSGAMEIVNGVTYFVFNVTSYSENNGDVVTIVSNGTGAPVVLNFGFSANTNLGGDVTLSGLNPDQVLWNFTSSGKNVNLNNNASSFGLPLAFQGDILGPNDCLSLTNANLDGRVLGGDSCDMQIVSGTTINAPTTVPEPPTLIMFAGALALLAFSLKRRLV